MQGGPTLANHHSGLRRLEAHLSHTEPAPTTPGTRLRALLLRALLAAGHQENSLTLAHGSRSLSIMTGHHHTAVSATLTALCAEPTPLVRKIQDASGRGAAVYELLPPPEPATDASPWSKGHPVHALRPVFRELGTTAAFLYEALELHGPQTGRGAAKLTGYSPTTVLDALALLEAQGLISGRQEGGNTLWAPTSPEALNDAAERLGSTEAVARLIHRYRVERLAWWAWLAERALLHQIETITIDVAGSALWPPGDDPARLIPA